MPLPQNDEHPQPASQNQDLPEMQEGKHLAWTLEHSLNLAKLLPASQFSWKELVDAYNQTRIDYIVPMPMNVNRLRDYVSAYDVSLDASVVALDEDKIVGLAMLGVRSGRAWPTRLGVLPTNRQHGLGQSLMEALLAQSRRLGAGQVTLEVIKGNQPAYCLFRKLGFQETRELLVLRRPPGPPAVEWGHVTFPVPYTAQVLDYRQILDLLQQRRDSPSWLTETSSLNNAGHLSGLRVELKTGDRGWLAYQNTIFQLTHLVLQTEVGDSRQVGQALLHALHTRHPAQDTNTENIPADDPHLSALWDLRYLEAFRRIEMRLDLPVGPHDSAT